MSKTFKNLICIFLFLYFFLLSGLWAWKTYSIIQYNLKNSAYFELLLKQEQDFMILKDYKAE